MGVWCKLQDGIKSGERRERRVSLQNGDTSKGTTKRDFSVRFVWLQYWAQLSRMGALKTREKQVGTKKQWWSTWEWTTWHEDVGVENAGADKSARRNRGGRRRSGKRGSGEAVSSDQTRWQLSRLTDNGTRGQSNLTKSASRGAHSPVRGHPRGSKVVPLNSWGSVSY